jgi:hypothetical protein
MNYVNHWIPDEFNSLVNFRQIDYRDFVYEADIGGLTN